MAVTAVAISAILWIFGCPTNALLIPALVTVGVAACQHYSAHGSSSRLTSGNGHSSYSGSVRYICALSFLIRSGIRSRLVAVVARRLRWHRDGSSFDLGGNSSGCRDLDRRIAACKRRRAREDHSSRTWLFNHAGPCSDLGSMRCQHMAQLGLKRRAMCKGI